MNYALIVALTFMLAGCVTEQECQAQLQAQADAINRAIDEKCQSYGLKPGTPPYGECRDRQLAMITNVLVANQQAAAQANMARSQAMVAAGQSMIQNASPPPMSTTTCRPNVFGSVTCSSF